jgi:hypothetical protein
LARCVFHAIPIAFPISFDNLVLELVDRNGKSPFDPIGTVEEQGGNPQTDDEGEKLRGTLNGTRDVQHYLLLRLARRLSESASIGQGTSVDSTRTHPDGV